MKRLLLLALLIVGCGPIAPVIQIIQTDKCPSGWARITYTSTGGLKMECLAEPPPSPTPPPSPSPTPDPSPTPSPSPSASPSPSPTPVPSPTPTPPPGDGCPKPDDVKLGFFASVQKTPGFRNTFNISPVYEGQTIGPESGCGDILIERYGEFERFVTGDGIEGRDPVELQTTNLYLMVDATNSDTENWSEGCPEHCHGTYLLPGKRTYCVSYKHMDHYRCQDGQMSPQGKLTGFGENRRGYDLAK